MYKEILEKKIVRYNDKEWCQIEIRLATSYQDKKHLSITGAYGIVRNHHHLYDEVWHKLNKNYFIVEGCGQVIEELEQWFPECKQYLPYHLNYMRAECEHQRKRNETYHKTPDAVCPDCGYKIGSAWLYEELPKDVIDWVKSLPDNITYVKV